MTLLDGLDSASAIPGDGTISGSPEESPSRNWYCYRPKSPPRFWRSPLSTIYQRRCQRSEALASSSAPWWDFFNHHSYTPSFVLKLFPTWLVTKMNMMVTISPKEQLYLATPGQYRRSPLLSVLISLIRSILHDPKTFNNPMEYQPERYLNGKLNPDVVDSDSVAFGFGRRSVDLPYSVMRHISHRRSTPLSICPGRYLGDNSLYILACCLLSVYDIKSLVDNQGNIIKAKAEFTSGVIS